MSLGPGPSLGVGTAPSAWAERSNVKRVVSAEPWVAKFSVFASVTLHNIGTN